MKKILVATIVSALFTTSAFAIEPTGGVPAGTVAGTTASPNTSDFYKQTRQSTDTSDFYTQMRQVQERLAALKAKNDPTVNVDVLQTELTNMQNEFQARINAVMNQFRPDLEKLNNVPDSALSPTALASKQQMNAIFAQIDALSKERALKAAPFVQAYTNAAKALDTFNANSASRVAAVEKLASDTATALKPRYTADKLSIRTSINSSRAMIDSLSRQIYRLERSLRTITPNSPNYGAAKSQIAGLMAQKAEVQKTLDEQRITLSDLGSNYSKKLNAIEATKAKAIVAINAEKRSLVDALNKANNALIATTRSYNTKISALYSKLATVSQPYNDAVKAFMLQNQTARKALSQQMETAVMAIQQEYHARVLAFLKEKGLA